MIPQNHDPANEIVTNPAYHVGLLILLAYASQHRHSRQWVGAIQHILAREGTKGGVA